MMLPKKNRVVYWKSQEVYQMLFLAYLPSGLWTATGFRVLLKIVEIIRDPLFVFLIILLVIL